MTDNFVTFRNNKSCRQKFGIGMGLLQIIFYVYKRIQTRENRNSNKKQRDQALFLIPKCHLLWSTYFQCIVKIGLKDVMLYFFHPEPVCRYLKKNYMYWEYVTKYTQNLIYYYYLSFWSTWDHTPVFGEVRVARFLVCRSLFSFVDLRFLITLLISPNSYKTH